jgi:hypothetical protein
MRLLRIAEGLNPEFRREARLKCNFCGSLGHRDVVPKEGTVRPMLSLLDGHRELVPQSLVIESAV